MIEHSFSRIFFSQNDENSPQNKINKLLPQMGSGQVGTRIGDSSRSRNRRSTYVYGIQDRRLSRMCFVCVYRNREGRWLGCRVALCCQATSVTFFQSFSACLFPPFWHPAMRIVCPSAESFEERRSFDFFVAVID